MNLGNPLYMVSFQQKKIDQGESLGEILKRTREASFKKIEGASYVLKINKKYLEALEKGDYWALPDITYSKNYLRSYAEYLGLDFDYIYGLFYKEWNIYNKTYARREKEKKETTKSEYIKAFVIPKFIKYLLLLGLVLLAFFYLYFQVKNIFSPPNLEIFQPEENYITNNSVIPVSGKTTPESSLTINGRLIPLTNNGEFEEEIPLRPGMNLLKISAVKKYSRENLKIIKIMMTGEEEVIGK